MTMSFYVELEERNSDGILVKMGRLYQKVGFIQYYTFQNEAKTNKCIYLFSRVEIDVI